MKSFFKPFLSVATVALLAIGASAQSGDWQDRIGVEPNQRAQINQILNNYGNSQQSQQQIMNVLRPDQRQAWANSGYDTRNYTNNQGYNQGYNNQGYNNNQSPYYNQGQSNNQYPNNQNPYNQGQYNNQYPYNQNQNQQNNGGGLDPASIIGPLLQSGLLNQVLNRAGGWFQR